MLSTTLSVTLVATLAIAGDYTQTGGVLEYQLSPTVTSGQPTARRTPRRKDDTEPL